MIVELRKLLLRDIASVQRELELYPDDAAVWRAAPGILNTSGTLALHLAGNLQHFIGAILGGTGYLRQRDLEFSRRDVPRAELLAGLDRAAEAVGGTLGALPAARLDELYPLELAGVRLTTRMFLLHLSTHLSFHLGQIGYHRRVVTGDTTSSGASGIAILAD